MFKDYTKQEKEAILFRIRSDIMIDLIPLTLEDLEEVFTSDLSAKELLSRMLFLPEQNWDNLFKDALEEKESLEELAKEFDLKGILNTKTYYCKDCTYEGNEDQFVHIPIQGSESFTLKCPDCEGIRVKRNS